MWVFRIELTGESFEQLPNSMVKYTIFLLNLESKFDCTVYTRFRNVIVARAYAQNYTKHERSQYLKKVRSKLTGIDDR